MRRPSVQAKILKYVVMPLVNKAMGFVLSNPRMRRLALELLNINPELKQRLWLLRAGIISQARSKNSAAPALSIRITDGKIELSEHAEVTYLELKKYYRNE